MRSLRRASGSTSQKQNIDNLIWLKKTLHLLSQNKNIRIRASSMAINDKMLDKLKNF